MREICLLGLISVFIWGCGSYTMELQKASLDMNVPEMFSGVGKDIPKNKLASSVSASLTYTPHDEIYMGQLKNEYGSGDGNPGGKSYVGWTEYSDFWYKQSRLPFSITYTMVQRLTHLEIGMQTGLDPWPFVSSSTGWISESFEFGGILYVGFEKNEASYEGIAHFDNPCYTGCGDPESGAFEYSAENTLISHFEFYAGGYISYNVDKFAVSYAGAYYNPWFHSSSLPVEGHPEAEEDSFDTFITTPFLLMHKFSLSYWINDNWKYSASVILLNNLDFEDESWALRSSMEYWF